jgi:hypothetical protein
MNEWMNEWMNDTENLMDDASLLKKNNVLSETAVMLTAMS